MVTPPKRSGTGVNSTPFLAKGQFMRHFQRYSVDLKSFPALLQLDPGLAASLMLVYFDGVHSDLWDCGGGTLNHTKLAEFLYTRGLTDKRMSTT